jgi:hypothetical protein
LAIVLRFCYIQIVDFENVNLRELCGVTVGPEVTQLGFNLSGRLSVDVFQDEGGYRASGILIGVSAIEAEPPNELDVGTVESLGLNKSSGLSRLSISAAMKPRALKSRNS